MLPLPSNSDLAKDLWRRLSEGEVETVRLATPDDLADFRGEPARCHDNVERWLIHHPTHRPVRGWAISARGMFDKHSVVDTGAGLLDITPQPGLGAQPEISIIRCVGVGRAEFEALPARVIYIEGLDETAPRSLDSDASDFDNGGPHMIS